MNEPTGTDLRRNTLPPKVWTDPICFTALGFGAGALPYAPGTAGTLVAVPLYWFLAQLSPAWYAGITLLVFAVGVWLCDQAERALGVHDHPGIVWDEMAGYLIAMFAAPSHWLWVGVGFVLFRLFDIWKPFPIRTAERRIRGGLGTMLDDALAGVYAWVALHAIAYLLHWPT